MSFDEYVFSFRGVQLLDRCFPKLYHLLSLQAMEVSVALHSCQNLVLSVFNFNHSGQCAVASVLHFSEEL